MRDREVVNRFCAFYLIGENAYKGDDMDAFLARALEKMNDMSDQARAELTEKFLHSMRGNTKLFGRHAFRKSLVSVDGNAARSILNVALFDILSVIMADISQATLDKSASALQEAVRSLMNDGAFLSAISYSTNSRKQVARRFEMARSAIQGTN